ncbi:MAG: GntR family transcriptional regulator [Tissierellia bacterium]|nr:GntR family transcriptional regulator [Tissierellia bacterium]
MIINLNLKSDIPIFEQIVNQIIFAIYHGELKSGTPLPPVRTLAESLGINFMTVNKAYQVLKEMGYIKTYGRAGTKVCDKEESDLETKEEIDKLKQILARLKLMGMTDGELEKEIYSFLAEAAI